MTSLLSDMRTVRPQGLTFRITQPHGLRILHLRATQAYCKELDELFGANLTFACDATFSSLPLLYPQSLDESSRKQSRPVD